MVTILRHLLPWRFPAGKFQEPYGMISCILDVGSFPNGGTRGLAASNVGAYQVGRSQGIPLCLGAARPQP